MFWKKKKKEIEVFYIYGSTETELFDRLNISEEERNKGIKIAQTVLMLLDRIEKLEKGLRKEG